MKVILTAFNGMLKSDIRIINGDFLEIQVRYCDSVPRYVLEKETPVPVSEPIKTAIFKRTGRKVSRLSSNELYPEYALKEIT